MIFDSHVHTENSSDSQMHITEAVKAAAEKKVGLVLTEHYDPATDDIPEYADWTPFDPTRFFGEYSSYRNDKLLLGVELGLHGNVLKENMAMAEKYDFDFLLGAVHAAYEIDLYVDLVHREKSMTTPEKYLKYNIDMVQKNPYIHSLAHIDYYSRYVKGENKDILYAEYKPLYKKLFEALLDNDTLIEINTRRLGDRLAYKNLFDIYKGFYESGGRYVTIGSDAHNPEAIASFFNEALEMAEKIGLTPVYFKERKRIIIGS